MQFQIVADCPQPYLLMELQNAASQKFWFSNTTPILILLNILFHAPMGRLKLELIYYFTNFSTVVPSNSCVFLSCRLFVVNMTFSTGLVVSSVSWLGQLTVGV